MQTVQIKTNRILKENLLKVKNCDLVQDECSRMLTKTAQRRQAAWGNILSQLPKDINLASIRATDKEITFELVDKPAIVK